MTKHLKAALAIAAAAVATGALADVTLYSGENLRGPAITARGDVPNLERHGFNDRASSIEVTGDRRDRWEVCEHAGYAGRCAVLSPGAYNSLRAVGLDYRISDRWNVRAEWARYFGIGRQSNRSRPADSGDAQGKFDIDLVSAGLTFSF